MNKRRNTLENNSFNKKKKKRKKLEPYNRRKENLDYKQYVNR